MIVAIVGLHVFENALQGDFRNEGHSGRIVECDGAFGKEPFSYEDMNV